MIFPKAILSAQDKKLVEALQASPLYRGYQEAFRKATGMSLFLRLANTDKIPRPEERGEENPFCQALNACGGSCEECRKAHHSLRNQAPAGDRACTGFCFAQMMESAVPIRCGRRVIAWLWTGQVFLDSEPQRSFADVAKILIAGGMPEEEAENLRHAWEATPEVSNDRYKGVVTLLSAFGQQIGEQATRMIMENQPHEPEAITRARRYVRENLTERVSLDEAAQAAGLSTHHFCKVFRRGVGLTFVDYVNRVRVDLARDRLLNPHARVSEVAFDCGFQSLSQFNRSFRAVTGENPTEYRRMRLKGVGR